MDIKELLAPSKGKILVTFVLLVLAAVLFLMAASSQTTCKPGGDCPQPLTQTVGIVGAVVLAWPVFALHASTHTLQNVLGRSNAAAIAIILVTLIINVVYLYALACVIALLRRKATL